MLVCSTNVLLINVLFLLKKRNSYDGIFSLFTNSSIFLFFFANTSMFLFFLGYHLKCLRLTPCITKRNHVWKCHLIFFFCNIIIDLFFVSEVLYEGSCSMKGAAQLLELNNDLSIHQRRLRYLAIEVFKSIMHLNPLFMWSHFEENQCLII